MVVDIETRVVTFAPSLPIAVPTNDLNGEDEIVVRSPLPSQRVLVRVLRHRLREDPLLLTKQLLKPLEVRRGCLRGQRSSRGLSLRCRPGRLSCSVDHTNYL